MKSLFTALWLLISTIVANAQVSFSISNINAIYGDIIEMPVKVTNFDNIVSSQFTLQWDPSAVELDSITQFNPALDLTLSTNFGTSANDRIGFLWVDQTLGGVDLPNNSTIFALRFKVVATSYAVSAVSFTDIPTSIEIANTSGVTADTSFSSAILTIGTNAANDFDNQGSLVLHQNQPNPFSDFTIIPYELAKPEMVTFSIYNALGQLISTTTEKKNAGQHFFEINRVTLPQSGVYTYRLETITQHIAKRFAYLD